MIANYLCALPFLHRNKGGDSFRGREIEREREREHLALNSGVPSLIPGNYCYLWALTYNYTQPDASTKRIQHSVDLPPVRKWALYVVYVAPYTSQITFWKRLFRCYLHNLELSYSAPAHVASSQSTRSTSTVDTLTPYSIAILHKTF